MKKKYSRYNKTRKALLFWCLFIGIGALWGAAAMFLRPDGSILQMQAMLPYFQKLPLANLLFRDYVFPGIALLCVNGIPNIVAAILLFQKKKAGLVCGTLFGITLMLWICIQFYMFPPNVLSTAYFIFGLLQTITGYAAWVFHKQEQFSVDASAYTNIGTNPKELVVYFSRMGYTKKVALEEANRRGAQLLEITTPEPTAKTAGFWWCGFFAMRGKAMPIHPITVDLSRFEHITICSPIWISRLCSPMKTFCEIAKGQVRQVSYILVHRTDLRFAKVVRRTDALLDITHKDVVNVCCKTGKMK